MAAVIEINEMIKGGGGGGIQPRGETSEKKAPIHSFKMFVVIPVMC